MRENPTPSEGVQRDGKGKIALQCIWRHRGNFTPSEGVGKCGKIRLLRKECRVDLRRKWLSYACSDGERPLLLQKEWGNAGETRLLRKEFRVDFR